jgi:ferredoxin-nitrate reductase
MTEDFKSICCYCGVGCGIVVKKDLHGRLLVEGDKFHPVNKGMLCSKGMNLHYTVMDQQDRLLYPEMRLNKNLPRGRVSWDQALDRTARVFKTLIEKYGPDSVGFYASGQCLTEEYYVVNKLIKGFIGSNNIDTNSRLCMSSAVAGYKMSLGEDSVPISYEDIELADCIFVAGANPAWCHPVLWRRVEAARYKNPSLKIIVSDPRRTQTCSMADVHLQINPGTDIILHHAIGRILIEKHQLEYSFIQHHTEGFERYRETVMQRTIMESCDICGISETDLYEAVSYIGNATGFISMWAMGLNQSVVGVNKNLSLINIHLITGHIGKAGNGPFSLTGQPNAMGGREVGGMANLLPSHRDLSNPADREYVQKFWKGVSISPRPGYTATEMFAALHDGRLKAVWIMCTNPLTSLPDAGFTEQALRKAKFVVVQEVSSKSQCLPFADVILPAAGWSEKEGTMTNSERRISHLNKITAAPGEALPDAEIICRFAKKMGFENAFSYSSMSEIFDEHAALSRNTHTDISGLNYTILKEKGSIQWPYPTGTTGYGAKRLFEDHIFYTTSKKAIIHSVPDNNQSAEINETYPLILTTGRIRDQWHTMTRTGKVNKLNQHISEAYLEINPGDAVDRNIADNALVEIKSEKGEVRVKAKFSNDIKKGVVFLPMHWGKILSNDLNRANNLTSNLTDPVSKEPDFKFTRVQVTHYIKPAQHIIVIGAGAAAYSFIKSYRELNAEDTITIFSKEPEPFYNRILLPGYISGETDWSLMQKLRSGEEKKYRIEILKETSVEHIDRKNRMIRDSNGGTHSYDVLVMATGSRAAMLKNTPGLKGIFNMRNRSDADRLKNHLQPGKGKVIVVGGGLLGIELAASLNEIDFDVALLHRTSRLMGRQLDQLGSRLLEEELCARNIDIYFNDEIDRYIGTDTVEGIKLKSGLSISCQAVIIAAGTIPNIELAKSCGLECKQGVIVNEYLQTSDPAIYAIGEISSFQGIMYGITAAAEQQAQILARYLSGDISKYYQGSLPMNLLKVNGMDLVSMGITECPDDKNFEEIIFIDKAKRFYKKCIIQNDRLVGAILIGDKKEFSEFRDLIRDKTELSEKRLRLLRSGRDAEPVIGKLICSCANVGEGNIIQKINMGNIDMHSLCSASGAGIGCGSCKSEVEAILKSTTLPLPTLTTEPLTTVA